MLQSLDVEAQGGGDGADIFSVELLQDGRLPRVVQPSARDTSKKLHTPDG